MKRVGIVGSGVIGLSTALELKLRGFDVTVITRNYEEGASWTSGGMLAPYSEGLEGDMLDFCEESLRMFDDFANKVEKIAGFNIDYRRKGIMRIGRDEEEVSRIFRYAEIYKERGVNLEIYKGNDIKREEPLLSEEIKGGVLFKDEGGVDTERLMDALLFSTEKLGIRLILDEIKHLDKDGKYIKGLEGLKKNYEFDVYIITTGAWNEIIPHLPVYPVKGQLLKIKGVHLERIYFSDSVYIIPKENHILIGATSEEAGFDTRPTLGGVDQLSTMACRTVPKLKESQFVNVLVGFRPATPDEKPVFEIGENYIISTGHYRNGILLTPVTSKIIADWVDKEKPSDYFETFSPERFGR